MTEYELKTYSLFSPDSTEKLFEVEKLVLCFYKCDQRKRFIKATKLFETKKLVRDSRNSYKLNYSIFLIIIGTTNCVFTLIPRLMAGSTSGKSDNLFCRILSIFLKS